MQARYILDMTVKWASDIYGTGKVSGLGVKFIRMSNVKVYHSHR